MRDYSRWKPSNSRGVSVDSPKLYMLSGAQVALELSLNVLMFNMDRCHLEDHFKNSLYQIPIGLLLIYGKYFMPKYQAI